MLSFGTPEAGKKNIVVMARQHPSETMSEYAAQGLIQSLGANQPPEFFDNAVLHIIPNMNPDGSYHGNTRTNAGGLDQNRQWNVYDNEKTCPEVFYVRREILNLPGGIAAIIDFHGEEEHPEVFPEGRGLGCTLKPECDEIEKKFIAAYQNRAPYLKSVSCYAPDEPDKPELGIATKFFAQNLSCLAVLFEMPFKQRSLCEDWTPDHCEEFGTHLIPALTAVLPELENKQLLDKGIVRNISFLNHPEATGKTSKVDPRADGCGWGRCTIM